MPKQSIRGLTIPYPKEKPKASGVYRTHIGPSQYYLYYSKIDNKWFTAGGAEVGDVTHFFIRT